MSRFFSVFLLLLFCAGANAAPQSILISGDSLSAGYGIPQAQSWPALLAKRLTQEGYPYDVANISISGETTSGGLARLAPALRQHRPALVIIALGANDGLRGLPLAQMRENLRSMIRQSQAAQARVLLIGMQLPPNYGNDYTREFQQAFTELARQHKTALLPFLFAGFASERDAFQNDGLHPTAATQMRILDNVWHELRPLLKKP